MARTSGGSRIQPRRSARLQRLREPRQVISETIDIVDSSDLDSIEEENMTLGIDNERDSPPRRSSHDNLEQNVGRTFKEIDKRFKSKSKRPPQSPVIEDCNESWFLKDHLGRTDANMGHTGNQANEEDFTGNQANADMGATRNKSNEEEVGEKIKKAKFCRKNFDTDESHGREQDNLTDDWTYWQQDNLADNYDDCNHYNKQTDVGNGDGCWDKYIQRNDVGKDSGQWDKWPSNEKDDIHIGTQCGTSTDHEDADNVNLEDEELKKDITELPEEDCVELLRDRAAEIINAKMQFEKDLNKAMGKHPDNKQLMIVKDVFSEIFNAKNGDGATKDSSEKRRDDSDVEKKEKQEDVVRPYAKDINEVDEFFMDPNLLDQIEMIEYLHSEEGMKEIEALYSKEVDEVPSFSLGP